MHDHSACREAVASVILPKPGSGGGSVSALLLGTQCVSGRGKVAGCVSCWALGSAHKLSLMVASAQHLSYEVLSLCLTLLCVCVYTRDQYYTLTLTERIFLCSFPYSGKPNTAQLENREERKLVRG